MEKFLITAIALAFTSPVFAVEKSGETTFTRYPIFEAVCETKKASHISHDHRTGLMKTGGIGDELIGKKTLKFNFLHRKYDREIVTNLLTYELVFHPALAGSSDSTKVEFSDLHSAFSSSNDYIILGSRHGNFVLNRTFKNEWHGMFSSFYGGDEDSSVIGYPIVCKFEDDVMNVFEIAYDELLLKQKLDIED